MFFKAHRDHLFHLPPLPPPSPKKLRNAGLSRPSHSFPLAPDFSSLPLRCVFLDQSVLKSQAYSLEAAVSPQVLY